MHLFYFLGFSVSTVSGLLFISTLLLKSNYFKGEFSIEKILFLTLSFKITDRTDALSIP